MDVRIRDYEAADRDACLAVFESNVPEFFTPSERAEFETFLSEPPGPYLVLEDEAGRVVACGGYAVEPGRATADLCWGMVLRDRQGSELGRRLTQARLERIRKDESARQVALRTSQRTRGFYERLGFVTERVVPNGFAPGLDRCEMRMSEPDQDRVEPALRWIAGVLERHGVPFQVVGGVAARAYGATRPVADIDLYIPAAKLRTVVEAVSPHVTRPPARHRGAHWDLVFVRLEYAGQVIELGVADDAKYWDVQAGRWREAAVEFEAADVREVFGVRVPVMPRERLLLYKRRLGRPVDRADVEQMARD